MMSCSRLACFLAAAAALYGSAEAASIETVKDWTVEQTAEWCDAEGLKGADELRKLGVDGMIVLHIDEEDLENDLMISSGIERKKFLVALEKLKTQFKGALPDQDFYQYRALDRRHVRCLRSSMRQSFLRA